jgi:Flp pilus assembly protein TadD
MRHTISISLGIVAFLFVAGCDRSDPAEEALKDLNVIDESNLSDIMLTAANPNEAVEYFRGASAANPDRLDLKRGLAKSLVRAGLNREAVTVWKEIVANPSAENTDRVDYADALIRSGDWENAAATLDTVPPTYETFKRYRLEAMVADSEQDWPKADSFYETAVGLTTQPASILNNWGYSKLTRGKYAEAEKLFLESLKYDDKLFTSKNNLVLARGAQRNYDLPVIPMTQVERAQLLHTLALTAIKQGDIVTGKSLLQQAIDTHPQHFEAAVRSLEALEENVLN